MKFKHFERNLCGKDEDYRFKGKIPQNKTRQVQQDKTHMLLPINACHFVPNLVTNLSFSSSWVMATVRPAPAPGPLLRRTRTLDSMICEGNDKDGMRGDRGEKRNRKESCL